MVVSSQQHSLKPKTSRLHIRAHGPSSSRIPSPTPNQVVSAQRKMTSKWWRAHPMQSEALTSRPSPYSLLGIDFPLANLNHQLSSPNPISPSLHSVIPSSSIPFPNLSSLRFLINPAHHSFLLHHPNPIPNTIPITTPSPQSSAPAPADKRPATPPATAALLPLL